MDLAIAHADVFTLREAAHQRGAFSISGAFDGCGWIPGWGVKQKSDSGRGQACSKFQHDGRLQNLRSILGISEIRITDPFAIGSQGQGVIMLSRVRYCWPGSNYPVTLHDCSPGPPPSAASAAEASLPVPRSPRTSFLSGMRPVPRSRPAPTFVEVCRVRHGPLLVGMSRGLRCVC